MAGFFPDYAPMTPLASPLSIAQAADTYQRMQAMTPLDISNATLANQENQLNLETAQKMAPINFSNAQIGNQANRLNLNRSELEFGTESALQPYTLQAAQQRADTETTAYRNSQVADVAQRAQALDESGDPAAAEQTWDEGFKALDAKGIPAVKQYIGGYRTELAKSLASPDLAKSNGPIGLSGPPLGTDMDAIRRTVATIPPEEAKRKYTNINAAIDGFNRIYDESQPGTIEEKWNAELQKLQQLGIPPQVLAPYAKYSPLGLGVARKQLEQLVPQRDALRERVMLSATGLPAPAVPPLFKPTAPVYLGPERGTNRPVVVQQGGAGEPVFTTGPVAVGAKPGAGVATYEDKLAVGMQIYGNDRTKAALYASGKAVADPTRTLEVASQNAARELYDMGPGFEPTGGPEAWLRNRTQELFRDYSTAGQPQAPAPANRGPVLTAPPPVGQRVRNQVYPTPKGPMKWTGTGWLAAQ